jgi:NAD(P)H dehydrogenase (quinone)
VGNQGLKKRMKVIVVYDSLTGNTKKIAEAIAEGAASVNRVNVEIKKIGEPFSVTDLTKADGVFFGSPTIYANVTVGMRNLVENMKVYVKAGMADFKGHPAAIFGSYGWDGAQVMESIFKDSIQNLGYNVQNKICSKTDLAIKHWTDKTLEECNVFGKVFAESL